jgi:hypothetical protein
MDVQPGSSHVKIYFNVASIASSVPPPGWTLWREVTKCQKYVA